MRQTAKRMMWTAAAVLAAASGALMISAGQVHAAVITVNSTADGSLVSLDGNGTCDLREAIEAANYDTAIGECSAGSGADVIAFNLVGCPCTILLDGTAGVLDITDALTINGPGATQLAIDGNNDGINGTRVFRIGFEQSATMSGLTIQNGYVPNTATNPSGAGILVRGSLTADGIVVRNNQAGDDDCFGCTGGGIHVQGGPLQLSNSTVSGNIAGGDSQGGGISQDPETSMTLTNVTISSNRTGLTGLGGGVYVTGEAEFNNVTVTNNLSRTGGGVLVGVSGNLAIGNSIIAGNLLDGQLASGPDCATVQQGVIDSQDYNLIGDLSGCTISGTTTHNLTGDAMLGTLQNNGGQTNTHALADTSPAVDAADPGTSCEATDQRGVSRPIDGDNVPGAVCDIGAYEKPVLETQPTDPPSTPEPTDPPTTPEPTDPPTTPTAGPTASPTTLDSGPTLPNTGTTSMGNTLAVALAFVLGGAAVVLLIRRPRPT